MNLDFIHSPWAYSKSKMDSVTRAPPSVTLGTAGGAKCWLRKLQYGGFSLFFSARETNKRNNLKIKHEPFLIFFFSLFLRMARFLWLHLSFSKWQNKTTEFSKSGIYLALPVHARIKPLFNRRKKVVTNTIKYVERHPVISNMSVYYSSYTTVLVNVVCIHYLKDASTLW